MPNVIRTTRQSVSLQFRFIRNDPYGFLISFPWLDTGFTFLSQLKTCSTDDFLPVRVKRETSDLTNAGESDVRKPFHVTSFSDKLFQAVGCLGAGLLY